MGRRNCGSGSLEGRSRGRWPVNGELQRNPHTSLVVRGNAPAVRLGKMILVAKNAPRQWLEARSSYEAAARVPEDVCTGSLRMPDFGREEIAEEPPALSERGGSQQ